MSEKETLVPIEAASAILSTSEEELTRLARRGVIPKMVKGQVPLIRTTTRLIKHLRAGVVTHDEAGAAMGTSGQWVRDLIAQGYVERHPDGGVSLVQAQAGYIRWLKDEERRSSKTAEAARVKNARAVEIEMRTARAAGELMEREDHEAIVSDLAGIVLTCLSALPARLTRDVTERRRVERIVDELRNQIVEATGARAQELRAVHEADGPLAEERA